VPRHSVAGFFDEFNGSLLFEKTGSMIVPGMWISSAAGLVLQCHLHLMSPALCHNIALEDRAVTLQHDMRRITISHLHSQLEHGFPRLDRERVDDQRGLQPSNAHRNDHFPNGRGASNSQGCCEPASAAILLKQPTCPTFRKSPWRYSPFVMNPRMRGRSPQLQLVRLLLRQESWIRLN